MKILNLNPNIISVEVTGLIPAKGNMLYSVGSIPSLNTHVDDSVVMDI